MRSTGAIVLLVLVLLVGFAGCAGCGTYNSLVQQDERVTEAWANVETQYQRRADLIAHHHERFDLALEVCAEPSTAADVMYQMFKRQLDAHQSRFAIGEALAHLNYLVEDGQLDRSLDENGVWRYRAEA